MVVDPEMKSLQITPETVAGTCWFTKTVR